MSRPGRRPPRGIGPLAAPLGANPYRLRPTWTALLRKGLQFAVASAELLLVLGLPPYRRALRRRIAAPVDLMVIGAQKAGTTWLHRQLRDSGRAALPPLKEGHHFDRGGLWTLRRYLAQFDAPPEGLPVIEVAPDYGPLPRWRIRAVRALFPELRVGFIARNPLDRAWSGTRMETAFDRGLPLERVPVRDLLAHLRLRRSRRYGDYAAQIGAWRQVLGAERVHVWPYERLAEAPGELLRDVLAAAGAGTTKPALPEPERRVFPGQTVAMPEAVAQALRRDYAPRIDDFAACLGPAAAQPPWTGVLDRWRAGVADAVAQPSRRIFVICGFAPSPRATSSGQKLAWRRITELAARSESVRLLYFVNDLDALDAPPASWPRNVEVLPPLRLTRGLRLRAMLRWPLLPGFASARRLAARRVLREQLADPALTEFHADFSQGIAAVEEADMGLFAFRQHDVVSRLYERMTARRRGPLGWALRLEAARARRWERRTWPRVMRLRTLSEEDARDLRALGLRDVAAEPVHGTLDADPARRTAATVIPGRIGFWGNMARGENADAALHMARVLLPRIRERVPGAELWIIGAHPAEEVLALHGTFVRVTGFVEDPGAVLATLDLAVAPLRLGSGVKIKVLETLEAGVPTLVSPVGGEGIPDHRLLLRAATDEEFIDRAVAALTATGAGTALPTARASQSVPAG